jgi:hypothetical protein
VKAAADDVTCTPPGEASEKSPSVSIGTDSTGPPGDAGNAPNRRAGG